MTQSPASLTSDIWNSTALLEVAAELILRAQTEGGAASQRLAEYPRHYTEIAYRCASGIGEVHAHFADTFFILAGSATLITGGKLVEPRKIGSGEARGTAITGEICEYLSAGSVVHIPAGLAHQMILKGDETITYFVMKIQEAG
jgi:mannose-6-phosphate isomerase-like protein (cupin superfamily)